MNLVDTAVNRPVSILVLTALFTGLAFFVIPEIPVALYPSVDYPFIGVRTSYAGASPQEVEEGVTKPLEAQLSGIAGLNRMDSRSGEGSSWISLRFDFGVDLDSAVSEVRAAIERVSRGLPQGADSPGVLTYNSDDEGGVSLVIRGDLDSERLLTIVTEMVIPPLERLEGVGAASTRGGIKKLVKVNVFQSRLDAYNLTINQITSALGQQNVQTGAGTMVQKGVSYSLRVDEKFRSLEEIRRTIVATLNTDADTAKSVNRSRVVRLEDIADVVEEEESRSSRFYIDGIPALSIDVQFESGSNSIQVADRVYEALPRINATLPQGVELSILTDSTTLVRSTLKEVYKSAVQGALLAILILALFLRNTKSTLIVGVSIPVAIAITLMGMYFGGITINVVSLIGLILGLGMIVDNSIVIMENIYRYRERGAKSRVASILGSKEMMTPIIASTLTTLCVFVPLIVWKDSLGEIGQMMQDLIFTVVISLSISLVVALTTVPALSSRYLPVDSRKQKPLENPLFIRLDGALERTLAKGEGLYRRVLVFALENRALVLTLVLALLVLSLVTLGSMGMALYPESSSDDSIQVGLAMPVGTSTDRTELFLREMEKIIKREVEGYKSLVSWVNNHTGRITINLPPLEEQEDGAEQIKEKLTPYFDEFSEATFSFSAGRRLGNLSPVSILFYSNDLDLAVRAADEVRALLFASLDGLESITTSLEDGSPAYRIAIDTERAAALGLTSSTVASTIRSLINGTVATTYWSSGVERDVLVRLDESNRSSLIDLESQYIRSAKGNKVSLANLATLVETTSPRSILREEGVRVLTLNIDLEKNFPATEARAQVERLLQRSYSPPEGVEIDFGGEAQEVEEQQSVMGLVILVAVIMVLAVMASQFESLLDPLIIFFSIPLLTIGVVLVYSLTGDTMNIFSLAGVVVLVGVVVNNGIVMVDYTNLLLRRGVPLEKAILDACQSRLRPILMTSFTTILGMVPMGFFPGGGTEFIRPIARTVVGGLSVSTLMTLVVTPIMYSLSKGLYFRLVKASKGNRGSPRKSRRQKAVEGVEDMRRREGLSS